VKWSALENGLGSAGLPADSSFFLRSAHESTTSQIAAQIFAEVFEVEEFGGLGLGRVEGGRVLHLLESLVEEFRDAGLPIVAATGVFLEHV